jgi:hypothetical protein
MVLQFHSFFKSHTKSSVHSLIPFLPLILRLPILKTRPHSIPVLPSSYPYRLASRSSTLHSRLLLLFYSVASQSQSYVTTDGQSASLSWCQAPIWGSWPDINYCFTVTVLSLGGSPLCRLSVIQPAVLGQLSVCTIFAFYMCHMLLNTYAIYTRPLSVRAQCSRLCPISGSFPITAV